jgi:hypothetical protein
MEEYVSTGCIKENSSVIYATPSYVKIESILAHVTFSIEALPRVTENCAFNLKAYVSYNVIY